MNTEDFEENIFPKVLANENLCRLYLKGLEKRGLKYSKPIETLSHDECIEIAILIYSDLVRREKKCSSLNLLKNSLSSQSH